MPSLYAQMSSEGLLHCCILHTTGCMNVRTLQLHTSLPIYGYETSFSYDPCTVMQTDVCGNVQFPTKFKMVVEVHHGNTVIGSILMHTDSVGTVFVFCLIVATYD